MTQENTYSRGIVMSGAGMLILSPDGLLLRLISDASTWDVIFYRALFTTLTLGVYLFFKEPRSLPAIFGNFGRSGWIATFLMTASTLSFVGAIANTSVANTLVLVATMPFFSAILGWLFIGEAVKPRTWVSIFLALTGIFVIFSGSFSEGNWLGDFLAILTALLQGLNLVVLRNARERNLTIPSLGLSGVLAALVVLPFAHPMAVGLADLSYLALMGFVIVPVSLVLFLGGARYAPAAEVALLALVETVLGPFWAWIGVGEVPSQMALVGGGIVISAIFLNAWLGMHDNHRAQRVGA